MSITPNLPNAHDATHNYSPPESKEVTPSHTFTLPASAARRTNYQMVGGILIPNEEGVRWFEEMYGRELRKDHSADASVRMELERILTEVEGEPLGVEYAPRRDAPWYDFLATTQLEKGIWAHDNPDGMDEVFLPGQQMKGDSAREEQMRGILCKLGRKPDGSLQRQFEIAQKRNQQLNESLPADMLRPFSLRKAQPSVFLYTFASPLQLESRLRICQFNLRCLLAGPARTPTWRAFKGPKPASFYTLRFNFDLNIACITSNLKTGSGTT
ncbi:hypothetical protein C8R44DRAFT_745232 [Mycena epipterygia]|nr:hypothetical protein C8R44DRAFT_745232 [Mycena epipterygia]